MTAAYLLFSALAALGFYLATPHQKLSRRARGHARAMRAAAWLCAALATATAIVALGVWAGAFAALTAIMLVAVALPYADAWRQLRGDAGKGRTHVG